MSKDFRLIFHCSAQCFHVTRPLRQVQTRCPASLRVFGRLCQDPFHGVRLKLHVCRTVVAHHSEGEVFWGSESLLYPVARRARLFRMDDSHDTMVRG